MIRVIVNPVAGHGRPVSLLPRVLSELERRQLPYEVFHSTHGGHAVDLARESDADCLLVMGGDGTLSEVVNGLGDQKRTLYFVPCGTGNDFVKTLRLPRDPLAALRRQLDGPTACVDLPRVNDRSFINVAGTGFDIEVLRQTERYKDRFTGLVAYLLGIVSAVKHFKPVKARLTIDGETFEKSLTIIEVANGQYIGGGMRVAPTANPSDGLFDVVYVDAVKRWQIPFLMPLFIPGWFVRLPITHTVRARSLVIESEGMTMNLDGELVNIQCAEFSIASGQITTHCPVPAVKAVSATSTTFPA